MASRPVHRVSKPKKGKEKYKKSKGGPAYKTSFETGDAGIWVTCDMGKEGRCAAEALDLFTQYCEKSLGIQSSSEIAGNSFNGDDDDDGSGGGGSDIEAQIKKEIANLKPKPSTPQLVEKVRSTTPCIVLFRVDKSIDPVKLVHDLCEEARIHPDQRKSRWIRRMTPIAEVRKVLSVDLFEFAKEILHPYFHAEAGPKKYAVRPSVRHNTTFSRDVIIQTVAAAVGPGHKVDLTNYDHTILVEIFENVIGLSVVSSDYDNLKRFNLMELYSPAPKPQQDSTS